MLWGGSSLEKIKFKKDRPTLIDTNKHKIIVSSHPSPLSCNNKLETYPCFNDADHFGEINKYLTEKGKSNIIWKII